MSTVINKAKSQYRKALMLEAGILVFITLGFFLGFGYAGFSFLVGSLASFIAHCVFVYWVFFRNSAKDLTKMTAFYRGEGIKWLVTILWIVACFKWIPNLNFVLFFVGYFIALLLNNLIPFVLSKRTH
ncbi:H(+)-transporting two-sector ATPase, F(0) subunit I [Mannheimia varigena USDA-ARS-USMARC-1296]|uniref:H(+)-transporting two-sector ATPase, F(0) subunit I n=1 Tax=Mannheimia varigena USDA-ARS-USMARC-1296 TaxID=1433287 RepID=W0Q6K3_9PAST|nr:ATP synthase subunit I [Mannheimia varigena]AHG74534.1 H(+)-transporting two-sector ATPase, F(0) subunit I [Mannheimia varigena USDA-ARS-USMARC-1296]